MTDAMPQAIDVRPDLQCHATDTFTQVDLSRQLAEPNNIINRFATFAFSEEEAMGEITVYDPSRVYISAAARTALDKECLAPAWIIAKYGEAYSDLLMNRVVKGKYAGVLQITRKASMFVYPVSQGEPIVVVGATEPGPDGPVRVTRILVRIEHNQCAAGASVACGD